MREKTADKVVRMYFRKLADQGKKELVKKPPLDPYGSLIFFSIAYGAFTQYTAELFKSESQFLKDREFLNLMESGDRVVKKVAPLLLTYTRSYASPFVKKNVARLKNIQNQATIGKAPTDIVLSNSALYSVLLPFLHRKPKFLKELFPPDAKGSPYNQMLKVGRAVASAKDAQSLLFQLTAVSPPPSMVIIRGWVKRAAKWVTKVGKLDTEVLMEDADKAKILASDLRGIERKKETVPFDTPEGAKLEHERLETLEKIDTLAQESTDPSVILATVASGAKPKDNYNTATGRKLGHTPEQERAMEEEGKTLIAAGAGSGKCIRGDFLVQTENGFIPISDICSGLDAEQEQPHQTTIHGMAGPEQTSHIYFDGIRQTLKMETTRGYEIEGTHKHKVLILQDGEVAWKELQEIELGDIVCLDRRPGLFSSTPFQREEFYYPPYRNSTCDTKIPKSLTEQVASLLGYIVSEGYIRKDCWGVHLTTTCEEQLDFYQKAMKGILTFYGRRDERKVLQYVVEFHRHADIQSLMNFGLTRAGAKDKEIPFGVLRSPKPIIVAFLKALFDGDGSVESNVVSYATASSKLAAQLHTLLLAFGIPSRKRFRDNEKAGAWHLTIGGSGLRRFKSEIGFNLTEKKNKLHALAQRNENTNIDLIPGVGSFCMAVKEQYKKEHGTSRTKDEGYGTLKCISNGSRRPSFHTLKQFLSFYPVQSPEWSLLQSLAEKNWFFDSVEEIQDSEAGVYDFVVPETHSFSAGGFINHNTRVLASKIAYHIVEKGEDPTSILATTFTKKAAAELMKRTAKYGAVIEGKIAEQGFGTTHSVAGKILNNQARSFRRSKYLGKNETWKQNMILRLAMEQVQKIPTSSVSPPPPPKSFWEDVQNNALESYEDAVEQGVETAEKLGPAATFPETLERALPYLKGLNQHWRDRQIQFIGSLIQRRAVPEKMSIAQVSWLYSILKDLPPQLNITYQFPTHLQEAAEAEQAKRKKKGRSRDPEFAEPSKKKKDEALRQYRSYLKPLNQWFNLGRPLVKDNKPESAEDDPKKEEDSPPIPLGEFRNAISILKGKGLTPAEAWHGMGPYEQGSSEAAVYAAYEFLKGNKGEPDFRNVGDMDDILIDAVKALIGDENVRKQLQSRYKTILVDEAQDLNRVQHLLFGLIAGYLNPTNLKPNEDGSMTATTYSLIGDDKQAIYEFRGADPDEFINKSDLTEGDEEFKTLLLETNFRSGEAIVESANRLIKHNQKQVPMVCKAHPDRNGSGEIVSRPVQDTAEAAVSVAVEIDALMKADDAVKYQDFGVAIRSNAEAFHYGVQMLQRGIPFRSNARFFNDANSKAIIGWLTIHEQGPNGDAQLINKSLREAARAPVSKIGVTFWDKVTELAKRDGEPNWLKWLLDIDNYGTENWRKVYSRGQWLEIAEDFIGNIHNVMGLTGDPSFLIADLLEMEGTNGKSMREALIDSVADNDEIMGELSAQAPRGRVTNDMVEEEALSPIDPLVNLVNSRKTLGESMEFVRKLQRVNEKISSLDTDKEIDRDAVTISTMHGWKGLECPNLYVPLVGGKFPRAGETGVAEEGPALWSERRLAYVAITRAEQRCVLLDIPNPKLGFHSQFLSESCPAQEEVAPHEVVIETTEMEKQGMLEEWDE